MKNSQSGSQANSATGSDLLVVGYYWAKDIIIIENDEVNIRVKAIINILLTLILTVIFGLIEFDPFDRLVWPVGFVFWIFIISSRRACLRDRMIPIFKAKLYKLVILRIWKGLYYLNSSWFVELIKCCEIKWRSGRFYKYLCRDAPSSIW